MSKVPTQAERVIDYICRFGSITRVEALMDLGIANLPAVIDVLRHKFGKPIITEEVTGQNRYGQKVTFARYHLIDEEADVDGN